MSSCGGLGKRCEVMVFMYDIGFYYVDAVLAFGFANCELQTASCDQSRDSSGYSWRMLKRRFDAPFSTHSSRRLANKRGQEDPGTYRDRIVASDHSGSLNIGEAFARLSLSRIARAHPLLAA